MSGLSSLLDIHAPVKTKQLIKPAPSWITDEHRTAKCMRRQYACRRDKSPENFTCLRRQINRCNHILNKNKGRFYHDLVSENCGEGKKLWQALNRILSRSNATVLPSFDNEKSLANRFGWFFIDKIKKIRDTSKHTPSKSLPDKEPPTIISFQVIFESEVLKFIKEAPSKTCSLDPCPTHIVKNVLISFFLHWQNWSICPSKMAFSQILSNRLLSHLSLKSPPFQKRTWRAIDWCLVSVFCQSWSSV